MLQPLRILRQHAITNGNEAVSQMFVQPNPCILIEGICGSIDAIASKNHLSFDEPD